MDTELIKELCGLAVEKGFKYEYGKYSPSVSVRTPDEIFVITTNIDGADKCLQAAIDRIKAL